MSTPARYALLVLSVVLALSPLAGQAAAGQSAATLEQVLVALGADKVDADYVVMVDTSQSMQDSGLYPQVRRTLRDFVAAMSPTDHLSLITFDEAPALRYSDAVGKAPDGAIGQLPDKATGGSTDIGSAIELALDELERSGAAPVASVLMVTDGKHEPPSGSRYPSVDSPTWQSLASRCRRLPARQVTSYEVALGKQADARLLKRVFASTTVLDLPARQIGPRLDQPKQRTRIAKARSVLQPDLGADVRVSWPASASALDLGRGRADLELTLRSTARHLPLLLSAPSIEVSGLRARAQGLPGQIPLAPGTARTVPVHLSWSTPGGVHLRRRTELRTGTLELRGRLESPWSAVISDDLQTRLDPKLTGAATAFRGTRVVGWSDLTLALLAVPILLLLAGAVLWSLDRNPRLRGVLRAQDPRGQDLGSATLRGRRLRLGDGGAPGLALTGDGTVRGRWARDRRGRGRELELWITYSRDGTPSRRGRAACRANSSITVSGVRFSYLPAPAAAEPSSAPAPAATSPPPHSDPAPDQLKQVPLE